MQTFKISDWLQEGDGWLSKRPTRCSKRLQTSFKKPIYDFYDRPSRVFMLAEKCRIFDCDLQIHDELI